MISVLQHGCCELPWWHVDSYLHVKLNLVLASCWPPRFEIMHASFWAALMEQQLLALTRTRLRTMRINVNTSETFEPSAPWGKLFSVFVASIGIHFCEVCPQSTDIHSSEVIQKSTLVSLDVLFGEGQCKPQTCWVNFELYHEALLRDGFCRRRSSKKLF